MPDFKNCRTSRIGFPHLTMKPVSREAVFPARRAPRAARRRDQSYDTKPGKDTKHTKGNPLFGGRALLASRGSPKNAGLFFMSFVPFTGFMS
jgi:hypothetical protein